MKTKWIPTAQRLGYVFEKLAQPKLAAVVDEWLPRRRLVALAGNIGQPGDCPQSAR
jgi:hypothetical protein